LKCYSVDIFLDTVEENCRQVDIATSAYFECRKNLYWETKFDEVPGAKLNHALQGMLLSIYSIAGADSNALGSAFGTSKPFIKMNTHGLKND